MSDLKSRLKEYISFKKLSVRAFEASIDVSFSYVNSMSKSIGVEKIQIIVEKYPDLSLKWLFTGKGKMINTNKTDLGDFEKNEIVTYIYRNINEFEKNDMFALFKENLISTGVRKELLLREEKVIKKVEEYQKLLNEKKK